MRMAATTTIKQTEYIPGVKPQEVYDALVDPRKHAEFTGAKATGQAKVGAKFTAWDGYITGKHLQLEPGKRLVQEWSTTEWPTGAQPSRLEWTFVRKSDGTEVTLLHSEVPSDQAESYRQGWIDYYWEPLKQYFEDQQE
jgi:activator of HSP90 ATPase